MFIKIGLLIPAVLISCSNCSVRKTTESKQSHVQVAKEIPLDKNGTPFFSYDAAKQLERVLKLESAESGYDSMQIRIWCSYGLSKERDLLIIRNQNGNWAGQFFNIVVTKDNTGNTFELQNVTQNAVFPKSGWNRFTTTLLNLGIATLPSMNSIENLKWGGGDGNVYSVEIATKEYYRFYWYEEPLKYAQTYWQAKNMDLILQLIENELSVRLHISS